MKTKFLRERVEKIAQGLVAMLGEVCVRVEVVGSVRRKKRVVGDLELLVIPVWGGGGVDLFGVAQDERNLAKDRLEEFVAAGRLRKRLREDGVGVVGWGASNCFAVHVASGLPIDIFFASEENWVSLLVCRTGPAGLNVVLCEAALARGLKWNPYAGLIGPMGPMGPMADEEAFFHALGVPYFVPERRCLLLSDGIRNDPDRRAL